jgi:hypothetical protein
MLTSIRSIRVKFWMEFNCKIKTKLLIILSFNFIIIEMSFFGPSINQQLEDQLFNIKMMTKVLNKNALKMKSNHKKTIVKIKKATKQNDDETALILADHAIQQRQLELRYTRLACKMEIIASITQSALDTKQITYGISNMISTVANIHDPMMVINQIENFESLFDDLNIRTTVVENTLNDTTALSSSASEEAKTLLSQIRESEAISSSSRLPLLNSEVQVEDIIKNKVR